MYHANAAIAKIEKIKLNKIPHRCGHRRLNGEDGRLLECKEGASRFA
jgi:hypothetical protein